MGFGEMVHAFCLEAAWNTDTICSTVAGDAGASMGVQRKKEREGDWEVQRSEKFVSGGRKEVMLFSPTPLYTA